MSPYEFEHVYPWATIVELLEGRSQRHERSERNNSSPQYTKDGERIQYTDNLAALGIGQQQA